MGKRRLGARIDQGTWIARLQGTLMGWGAAVLGLSDGDGLRIGVGATLLVATFAWMIGRINSEATLEMEADDLEARSREPRP